MKNNTTKSDKNNPRKLTWLWVLGWICIFPLPLTILLLRRKDMNPAIKYGAVVVAWVLFFAIGLSGNNETDNPQSDVPSHSESSQSATSSSDNLTETQATSHIHSYSSVVTAPTCTEKGYTTYTCACGDTYTADETPATEHVYSEATCTKAPTCSTCGATNGSASGHNWIDATCTSAKKCSFCGEINGSALGHSFNKGKCTRCGTSDPDYTEPNTSSETVYITATGKKYHSRKGCPGLSNAKEIYETTLSDAKGKSLEPCSKCH